MQKLQELVRLHRLKTPVRTIARRLHISPNTERLYRQRLKDAGLLEGDPDQLPDLEALRNAVHVHDKPVPKQERSSIANFKDDIHNRLKKGAGPTAIFQALQQENPEFNGSLSAVKRVCRRLQKQQGPKATDVAIPVHTPPGDVAQIDFGYLGRLRDPATGTDRKAWVFVMILGFSRHLFAWVVFDQTVETWLDLHRRAFEAFGGVPKVMVPDNLKAVVIRAAFGADDPTALNRSYRELARHYRFEIDPTPPYSPQKKGKVEAAVKYVQNNFYKPREFTDVHDCNTRLTQWVDTIAGQRTHGTTGKKPREVFDADEKSVLQPLPEQRYQPVIWHGAKVGKNSHVHFQGRFYSVPWLYVTCWGNNDYGQSTPP